jgi:type IV pilus assembly protein PilM
MAKVLSIELGHSVIKLCEMDYKVKKPKIYQCQEAITPLGAVQDGYIKEEKLKDLAYSIKETIARNGIKTKKVIFTVASSKIITREVVVPNVKESQIGAVVQANLSEYFPVSLADYEVTQSLVQTIAEGADVGKHRVLVFAAERSMLNQYKALASECGLDILNVCCSGASIIEAARNAGVAGCQAIIKMEEKYSIISVMKDGVLMLQRSINYGVGDAMSEVATQPSFAAGDTLGVWRLITRQNCTTEPVSNVKEAGRPEAREAVTAALNPLLSGVMRVFDYFGSHFNGEEIENVSIIGLGAQFIGVPEILGEALGIVCKKAGMLHEVEVVDSDVKQKSDAYFSCIGAGFSGEGFLHDTSKDKAKKQADYTSLTILVVAVVVVAAVAIVALSILPYNAAKKEEARLQTENALYQEGLTAYNEYIGTQNIYQKFLHGDSLSKHANDGLLAFLSELEEKLPADVELQEFSSDDEQAQIKMSVADKEIAAKTIETIRGFESVQSVSVDNVEEKELTEDDQKGKTTAAVQEPEEAEEGEEGEEVSAAPVAASTEEADREIVFTITCVYYPIVIEPEEVANTAAAAQQAETTTEATTEAQ